MERFFRIKTLKIGLNFLSLKVLLTRQSCVTPESKHGLCVERAEFSMMQWRNTKIQQATKLYSVMFFKKDSITKKPPGLFVFNMIHPWWKSQLSLTGPATSSFMFCFAESVPCPLSGHTLMIMLWYVQVQCISVTMQWPCSDHVSQQYAAVGRSWDGVSPQNSSPTTGKINLVVPLT